MQCSITLRRPPHTCPRLAPGRNESVAESHPHAQAINALHNIKNEAISMKDNILNGDFKNFVKSMTNGWENKKKSSSVISNSFIEEIYNCAIDNGALAGKVSGAGGGGFMVFFVPIV